jgi:hypothetical protein
MRACILLLGIAACCLPQLVHSVASRQEINRGGAGQRDGGGGGGGGRDDPAGVGSHAVKTVVYDALVAAGVRDVAAVFRPALDHTIEVILPGPRAHD